jgi:hypothetical protein
LAFGGIFLGRASSIFSPVASGYELKNGLASPKNLLAKTSNNLLHNVFGRPHLDQKRPLFVHASPFFRPMPGIQLIETRLIASRWPKTA